MTFYAIADARVDSRTSDINYGGADLSVSKYQKEYYEYSFLRFDVSDLPDGAEILSATLSLYAADASGGFPVALYFVSDDSWVEGSITWDNKPSEDALLDSVNLGDFTVPGWVAWELDGAYVKDDDNLSLVLLTTANKNTVEFYSKEYSNAEYHPKLIISYIPLPSTALLLGTGLLGLALLGRRRKRN